MTSVLLDTDILSEIIKGKNAAVLEKAATYLGAHERLTTSAISVSEIVYGLRRVGREDRLAEVEALLVAVEVLPFDESAARTAGRINADLERNGRKIGLPDVMIAAIALRASLPVATGNVAHFEFVRSLGYDVSIDNWRGEAELARVP